MMKKYEKPQIYIEKFELSQHIAACAWDMSNHDNVQTCSAVSDSNITGIFGVVAFNDGVDVCINGELDVYCYTTDSEGWNIFNS